MEKCANKSSVYMECLVCHLAWLSCGDRPWHGRHVESAVASTHWKDYGSTLLLSPRLAISCHKTFRNCCDIGNQNTSAGVQTPLEGGLIMYESIVKCSKGRKFPKQLPHEVNWSVVGQRKACLSLKNSYIKVYLTPLNNIFPGTG